MKPSDGSPSRTENQLASASPPPIQFRFKSHRSSSRHHRHRDRDRSRDGHGDDYGNDSHRSSHRRHRHRRHHHRRHHHRRRSASPEPEPPVSPNSAFRESLFDALADDEGAMYWESVYGQPIHAYARPAKARGEGDEDGRGELELMTDEEYAAYVRARMWERTHEGILEERERRERRRREGERLRQTEQERLSFQSLVDESLRRGQERRAEKEQATRSWTAVWNAYLHSWEVLNSRAFAAAASNRPDSAYLRNTLVWPVKSGKRRDVTADAVEEFVYNVPASGGGGGGESSSSSSSSSRARLASFLKSERVRWHPDKILHRYGSLGVEDQVLQSATAVFQIMDRLWANEKGRQS